MDPGKLDKHEECRTLKDCKCNKEFDIFGIPKILESLGSLGNLETLGPLEPSEPLGALGNPWEPRTLRNLLKPPQNAGTLSQIRRFAQCIRVTQSLLLHKNP